MKFHEVSKAMDEGKKIKLKDWDERSMIQNSDVVRLGQRLLV